MLQLIASLVVRLRDLLVIEKQPDLIAIPVRRDERRGRHPRDRRG